MHTRRLWARLGIAAPLVLLSVGCQEEVTAPAATTAASVPDSACGNRCDLVADATVLGAARFQADSATLPIVLASVTVSGRANGTVRLALSADGAVRGSIPAAELVQVETPAGIRSFPLRDLATPAEVYRFTRTESVTLRYTLNRRMAVMPSGSFRLVQTVDGGIVTASRRPWHRSAPVAATLAAGSCTGEVDAPSSTACGVSITAAPFAGGALGGTFGSDPCCGPSHDVVVTFAPGVSSVTATIYDPTYAGNRTVATDANGVVVGSADFAFTNQPGNNVPDTKTISVGGVSVASVGAAAAAAPAGIARLDLIASTGIAEGDYISWTVTFTVQPQDIDVVCTGSGQARGTSVSCEAKPHDPAGTLEVSGWTFVSSAGDVVTRSDQATSTVWAGQLLIGGEVTATGTVDGQSTSGKTGGGLARDATPG